MRPNIEEWSAQNEARHEWILRQLNERAEEVRNLEIIQESPDQDVSVTMGSDLKVRRIQIDPESYEEHDEDSLAEVVIATIANAKRSVNQLRKQVYFPE